MAAFQYRLKPMTAVDIINEIKTLAPEELAEVIRFLRELEVPQAAQPVALIDERAFEAAARQVLNRHAVLLQKLAS